MPSGQSDKTSPTPSIHRLGEFDPLERQRLVRLAYRFVWNLHDAEDVVQDALVTARQKANDVKEPNRWWNWLMRIVVQRCHLQKRRQRMRRRAESLLPSRAEKHVESTTDQLSPQATRLRTALLELPDRQRDVLVLRHLEDMPFEQIGEVLGISPVTARVHAHAGREALRKRLTCAEGAPGSGRNDL
ncbi:MAG: sigma-70 family RNA polymerase sigma factor [Phycisphaerae bacterium]|nr:sigma-70 family RNA polymerase sigma factor [Phycisphaerae bacterium]